MDVWITQARQDKVKTVLESHSLRLLNTEQRHSFRARVASQLDVSCISKRIEAGTRSSFYEHLLTLVGIWTMSGETFTYTSFVHT